MKKDLKIFIKLASYGTFFIMALILFIIGVGIYSLTNTSYDVLMTHTTDNNLSDSNSIRHLYGINQNFSTLAGMLGIGYFLHSLSIPIVRKNKN